MTLEILLQIVASGLLMGLIYALIAVGLSLIFGLMDVVNFAHGEFMMLAMYAVFGAVVLIGIDPLMAMPIAVAALFVVGATAYLGVVQYAMRAKANIGMVQIFATFGLAIVIRGVSQFLFTSDYRNIPSSWLGGKTISLGGVYLPLPQLVGGRHLDRGLRRALAADHPDRFRQGARGDARGCRARSRWSASTRTASSRSAGGSARRSSGSRARSSPSSTTSTPMSGRPSR